MNHEPKSKLRSILRVIALIIILVAVAHYIGMSWLVKKNNADFSNLLTRLGAKSTTTPSFQETRNRSADNAWPLYQSIFSECLTWSMDCHKTTTFDEGNYLKVWSEHCPDIEELLKRINALAAFAETKKYSRPPMTRFALPWEITRMTEYLSLQAGNILNVTLPAAAHELSVGNSSEASRLLTMSLTILDRGLSEPLHIHSVVKFQCITLIENFILKNLLLFQPHDLEDLLAAFAARDPWNEWKECMRRQASHHAFYWEQDDVTQSLYGPTMESTHSIGAQLLSRLHKYLITLELDKAHFIASCNASLDDMDRSRIHDAVGQATIPLSHFQDQPWFALCSEPMIVYDYKVMRERFINIDVAQWMIVVTALRARLGVPTEHLENWIRVEPIGNGISISSPNIRVMFEIDGKGPLVSDPYGHDKTRHPFSILVEPIEQK
ncbi:MAG: hypothetical protein AB7F75_05120 [Planctomycetota bacterium]